MKEQTVDQEYVVEMTVTRRERWLIRASSAQAAGSIADEGNYDEVLADAEIVHCRVDKVWSREDTSKILGT